MPLNERRPTVEIRDGLRADLERLRREVRREANAAADGLAQSNPMVACAQLRFRVDGMRYPMRRWVTDAPKTGETSATATGCFCYYDPGTDSWRREGNDQVMYLRSSTGECVYVPELTH